jgi:hypothetical protein
VNRGLRTGRGYLSRPIISPGFFVVLLCGFILVGHTDGQEVIVARETKPEAPKQAASPPEQTPSESATPEPERAKSKSRKKSSAAEPTLEQMRRAGALAAERLTNPSASQKSKPGESESEAAPTPSPVVSETPRPVRKEARSEQTSTSRRPSPRTGRPDAAGVVRPTFMESGREQPTASPPPKGKAPAP